MQRHDQTPGKGAPPGWATRAYLLALMLALVIPTFLFAAYLLTRYAEAERTRIEELARDSARDVAGAVDRRVGGMIDALETLALTQDIAPENYQDFHERLSRAAKVLGRNIVLRDLSGQQVVNPRVPWGEPLPRINLPADERALAGMRPAVSDVFNSPIEGALIVSVVLPVARDGKASYLLGLSQELEAFERLLRGLTLGEDYTATIFDSRGRVIARSRDSALYAGRLVAGVDEGSAGAIIRPDIDGEMSLIGWATSETTGWRVAASVPYAVVDGPRREVLLALAGLGGLVLFGSAGLAWGLGGRISRSLRSLNQAGAELGARRPVPPVKTPLSEVNAIGEALRDAGLRMQEYEARLERALAAARMFAFECQPDEDLVIRSLSAADILGETTVGVRQGSRAQMLENVHPEDREAFERAVTVLSPSRPDYQIEYRYCRPNGEIVWLQTSGVGEFGPSGELTRVTGFTRDITSRKRGEIRRSLLVRELHHRVKNNLATVLALANLTGRHASSIEDYKIKLRARIQSMARSHALLNETSFRSAQLRRVLQDEFAPYSGKQVERFSLEGPDVELPEEAALALAMAVHELTTNAGKYGALSREGGRVDVQWDVTDTQGGQRLRLRWRESGGPAVAAPGQRGFGSRLLDSVIRDQLKGSVDLRFEPEGLVAQIEASLEHMARREAPDLPALG